MLKNMIYQVAKIAKKYYYGSVIFQDKLKKILTNTEKFVNVNINVENYLNYQQHSDLLRGRVQFCISCQQLNEPRFLKIGLKCRQRQFQVKIDIFVRYLCD